MFGEEKTGMLLVSSCFTLVCRELSSSPRMREGAGGVHSTGDPGTVFYSLGGAERGVGNKWRQLRQPGQWAVETALELGCTSRIPQS